MRTFVVVTCLVFVFGVLLTQDLGGPPGEVSAAEIIAVESGAANATTGIYLSNRVYDTLFEILVFSVATIGVSFYTRFLGDFEEKSHVVDSAVVTTGRLIALLAMLSGFYLAFWGHLTPGGGFAAGVAGGTSLLLVALTSSFENMERSFERVRAVTLEKLMTAVFTVCVLLQVAGCSVPTGKVGNFLSGGLIPVYNVIIFVKVTTGSWIIVYSFIKHRGLL